MTVNTAIVSGNIKKGSDGDNYSGGAENFPRFLKNWNNKYFKHRSFDDAYEAMRRSIYSIEWRQDESGGTGHSSVRCSPRRVAVS